MNGSPAAEVALHEDHLAMLARRYETVLARIEAACRSAGRSPDSVRLLAVSKTFDAGKVLALFGLGQAAFGENYVQEALEKIAACRTALTGKLDRTLAPESLARASLAPEWHFIGPIQSNKTRAIAEHFDWVHSIDRVKIAERLGEQRPAALPPLHCCVQVNVSGEASKSGCTPAEALDLARAIVAQPRLRLRGVMAIPEPTSDESLLRQRFAMAREVLMSIRERIGIDDRETTGAEGPDPSGQTSPIDTLSTGMSADLEVAIAEGATIVRIGSALFGERPRKASPAASA